MNIDHVVSLTCRRKACTLRRRRHLSPYPRQKEGDFASPPPALSTRWLACPGATSYHLSTSQRFAASQCLACLNPPPHAPTISNILQMAMEAPADAILGAPRKKTREKPGEGHPGDLPTSPEPNRPSCGCISPCVFFCDLAVCPLMAEAVSVVPLLIGATGTWKFVVMTAPIIFSSASSDLGRCLVFSRGCGFAICCFDCAGRDQRFAV